jgi:hypothetical protein
MRSDARQVPRYSRLIVELVFTPAILYLFLFGNLTMFLCALGF